MNAKPVLAVALLALAPVVGCSDGEEDQAVIEGPEITTPDSAERSDGSDVTDGSGQPDGGSGLEAPVIVDGPEPVEMKVGQFIDVTTDGVARVDTSDGAVLEVSQPSDDGSAQFNAGAEALAPGEATLVVSGADSVLYQVEVSVQA